MGYNVPQIKLETISMVDSPQELELLHTMSHVEQLMNSVVFANLTHFSHTSNLSHLLVICPMGRFFYLSNMVASLTQSTKN